LRRFEPLREQEFAPKKQRYAINFIEIEAAPFLQGRLGVLAAD
jgi:hypothetical protein